MRRTIAVVAGAAIVLSAILTAISISSRAPSGPVSSEARSGSPRSGTGIRPAPETYRDVVAGFQITLPQNWVERPSALGTEIAPNADAFPSPGQTPACGAETFSVAIRVSGEQAFDDALARAQGGDVGYTCGAPMTPWRVRDMSISGRRASALHVDGEGCGRCVKRHVMIEWDAIVIYVETVVVNDRLWAQYRDDFEGALATLQQHPVHDYTPALRRFMDARIAGRGAEPWMTTQAARSFDALGLYAITDRTGSYDITSYSLAGRGDTSDDGSGVVFVAWVRGDDPELGLCYRLEHVIMDAGSNRSGDGGDPVVLDVSSRSRCGTS